MIHVIDEKTDKILAVLSEADFYNDEYEENLKGVEKFKFFMSALHSKAGFFASRRKIVIPGEDGEFKEFILQEPLLINNTKEIYTVASYTDLRKQKIIDPIVLEGQTAFTAGQFVVDGTSWQMGIVEYAGIRKVEFTDPLDAYDALWEVAKLFGLELRFRVVKKGGKIVARYVDMVKRRGELSGKEVVFGKDIEGIERHETAGELVTALKCYGPVREDGSRMMVVVEDEEAFQKWNDHGRHLWGKYEPQTENSEMTEDRLRTLGEMELAKRITPQIQYKLSTIALEHIYGLEHEKVRLGDTNRVKDESKNPPIYLDARVISIRRSIKKSSRKIVEYGDFIEYTREEVMAEWKKLQAEFQRKLAQLMLVSITSSSGNIFKNGEGSTVLTVNTFLGGTEYDMNGTRYTYKWTKHDKDGNVDASFNKTGKSITVTSADVLESAAFSVEVSMSGTVLQKSQITVTDVNDGEDGAKGDKGDPGPQGPTGPKGETGTPGKDGIAHMGPTAPSNPAVNATWFKTDTDGKIIGIFKWSGTIWIESVMTQDVLNVVNLAAISADLGDVTAGTLTGVKITVGGTKGTVTIQNDEIYYVAPNGWVTKIQGAEILAINSGYIQSKLNPNGLFIDNLKNDLEGVSFGVNILNGVTHGEIFADNEIYLAAYGGLRARVISTGISLEDDNIISTADRSWIAPTLLNGVSNYGGGYETAAYYKDALGHVHLRGFLTGSADGKHIFTLPAGYRPGALKTFSTWSNSSVGTSRITIAADGKVTATVSGNWLSLDGIYFLYAN